MYQRIKLLTVSVICHPIVGQILAFLHRDQFKIDGFRIATNSPHVDASTKASLFWGFYESAERRLVRKYLPGNFDVVELGSSLGVVSLAALSKVEPQRKFIAVEANPYLHSLWSQNIDANFHGREVALDGRVVVSVGDPGDRVSFEIGRSTSSHVTFDARFSSSEASQFATAQLSEILLDYGIHQHAMIADIEGAEAGFILHEAESLRNCQVLIIELHNSKHRGDTVTKTQLFQALIDKHGFRLLECDGSVFAFDRG